MTPNERMTSEEQTNLLIRIDERVAALTAKLDDIVAQFQGRLRELDEAYAALESRFVPMKVYVADLTAIREELDEHKGIFRWVSLAVGGAFLAAVLGLILK